MMEPFAAAEVLSQGMYFEVLPPRWLFVLLVVVFVLVVSAGQRRQERRLRRTLDVKVCPRCGANGQPHAMFCGKCGARLPP